MLDTRVNWPRRHSQQRVRECARTNSGERRVQAPATKLGTARGPNANMSRAGGFASGQGAKVPSVEDEARIMFTAMTNVCDNRRLERAARKPSG
jgi:hypothetical protein